MKHIRYILFILLISAALPVHADDDARPQSSKAERNFIKEGNEEYNNQNYKEAERYYRKALEVNNNSEAAKFNLASALVRQSTDPDYTAENNPLKEAVKTFEFLSTYAMTPSISEKSFFNLGNITFNNKEYAKSVEFYKEALRINPDNDMARENLRQAQIKLKEQEEDQQQQQQNQSQDQEQEQQQDQQQQNQQNQQEQEQEQNQQEQNNPNQQPQEPTQNEQQPAPNRASISDENAEMILKTMENEERETRERIEEERKTRVSRRVIDKPW